MTAIAGALTADGIILGTDCRLTVKDSSGHLFFVDDAQKVLMLGEYTAIGFSGDLHTASILLSHLRGPESKRRRLDGISIGEWLPKFVRAAYAALVRTYPAEINPCSFLVASTIPGRTQRVPASQVSKFLQITSQQEKSNYLVMRIINCRPDQNGLVEVPGSNLGLLYSLNSPDFTPCDCDPLAFAAIGSGADDMRISLEKYAPFIFCDRPDLFVGWFMEAIASVFAKMPINSSVGGLFLITILARGKIKAILYASGRPNGGCEVVIENGRFVQVDRRTGRRIALRYPGEIDQALPATTNVFPPYRTFWTPPPPLEEQRFPEFIHSNLRESLLQEQSKRNCRHAILNQLNSALKVCQKFSDLNINPGDKIQNLFREVRRAMIIEGIYEQREEIDMIDPERESAFIIICERLHDALEECKKFDDLKINPGEQIDKLLGEISQMMMKENMETK